MSYPTTASLARDYVATFGTKVDPRTIANDIADMRYKMNAPIQFNNEKKGYIYTDPAWTADILKDAPPEIPASALGLGGLAALGLTGVLTGNLPNTLFLSALHLKLLSAFADTIIPSLKQPNEATKAEKTSENPLRPKPFLGKITVIEDMQTTPQEDSAEAAVKDALMTNKEIEIEYEKGAAGTKRRVTHCRIRPLHLVYVKNECLVFGSAPGNEDSPYTLIALRRIVKAEPTGGIFLPLKYLYAEPVGNEGIEIMFSTEKLDTILIFANESSDDGVSPEWMLLSKFDIYARVGGVVA
jgi:hypothetical protein